MQILLDAYTFTRYSSAVTFSPYTGTHTHTHRHPFSFYFPLSHIWVKKYWNSNTQIGAKQSFFWSKFHFNNRKLLEDLFFYLEKSPFCLLSPSSGSVRFSSIFFLCLSDYQLALNGCIPSNHFRTIAFTPFHWALNFLHAKYIAFVCHVCYLFPSVYQL